MAANKKTPVWAWVGCGCVLLVGLGIAAIGGAGFLGYSQLTSMVDDLADPLKRDEATMRMLGAEALPEGWHSHVFFQIPFIMKIAMLTDGEIGEAIEGDFQEKAEALENLRLHRQDFDRNLFIFFKIKGRGDEPMEDLLAGRQRSGHTTTEVDLDVEIQEGELLDEGQLEIGEQKIQWRAKTGTMGVVGGQLEGIYAAARISCPKGEDADALWFQAYSKSEAADTASTTIAAGSMAAATEQPADGAVESGLDPEGRPEIAGSPADPAALEWLFGHFDFCA